MEILVVSQVYPYPLHDGGRVDVYSRLEALHELGAKITLIAFTHPHYPPDENNPLQKLCENIYCIPFLRRNWSKLFHWKPYMVGRKENYFVLETLIPSLRAKQFSAIISESHHVLTVVNRLRKELNIPHLYLRSHNCEPRFLRSVARSSPLLSLQRPFFYIESIKYHLYEKQLLKFLQPQDAIWHISFDEYQKKSQNHPSLNHHFLPAAVSHKNLRPYQPKKNRSVLFAGALFSPNNQDALEWYLKQVHPLLLEVEGYQLVVAGNTKGANPKWVERWLNKLMFYDTPKEMEPIYEQAALFINPMRYGAGVKLKTIDAIARGIPVVSTPVGNEGTGFLDESHLLIREEPSKFAEAIKRLLNSEEDRKNLATNAQTYYIENYNQKLHLSRLL